MAVTKELSQTITERVVEGYEYSISMPIPLLKLILQNELERFYGVEHGKVQTASVSVDLRAEPNSNVVYTVLWTKIRNYGLITQMNGDEIENRYYMVEYDLSPEITESRDVGCP